ncbi:DUF4238 domain-containing protein [Brucella anthropi]|uniref:DUF4238 domain-containing protein n=1 Tax=Brucella anthropi TaxID=529 RepID=UPI00124C013D|nr:DUF4238 domain-containing protein [Brucella anthropi]KAB2778190.1 DUF4238 domain-containing protein [Brucella anthropi]
MADNKRQHYVPKSLLRRFAVDFENKQKPRQINLVNIASGKVVRGASLSDQCYVDYFYGKNLLIEKALGQLEGSHAELIRKVIESCSIKDSDGWSIVQMLALQKARTLRAEEEYNNMVEKMTRLWLHGRVSEEALRSVKIGLKDAANHNVATTLAMCPILFDLKQFLIINETSIPFIIADNPVVQTNWFGRVREPRRMVGITRAGLQMLMPLSPRFAVLLHDPNVYGADADGNVIRLKRRDEVVALNELQWLNAHKNVYFPPSLAADELDSMMCISRAGTALANFTRAERVRDSSSWKMTEKDEFAPPSEGVTSELVLVSGGSLPKDIRLRAVRIRSRPRYHDDGSIGSFVRDPVWEVIVDDFASIAITQEITLSDFWGFVADHPYENQVGPWLRKSARRGRRKLLRRASSDYI